MRNSFLSNTILVCSFVAAPLILACSSSDSAICDPCCIQVATDSARSCDLTFTASTATPASFAKGVRGASLARGGHLAIALSARTDTPLGGNVVTFGKSGEQCALDLISAACYERQGRAIPNPDVRLVKR
jgi:hypothetical protein